MDPPLTIEDRKRVPESFPGGVELLEHRKNGHDVSLRRRVMSSGFDDKWIFFVNGRWPNPKCQHKLGALALLRSLRNMELRSTVSTRTLPRPDLYLPI